MSGTGSAVTVSANSAGACQVPITIPAGSQIINLRCYVTGSASGSSVISGNVNYNFSTQTLNYYVFNPTSVNRSWTPYGEIVFVRP